MRKILFVLIFAVLGVLLLFVLKSEGQELSSCEIIDEAGIYYLSHGISDQDGNCFEIQTSDVTIDCKGHVIDGDKDDEGYGIYVNSFKYDTMIENITIKNCIIREFDIGIFFEGAKNEIKKSVILNTLVRDNGEGIVLLSSFNNTLKNITSVSNSNGVYLLDSSNNYLEDVFVHNNEDGLVLLSSHHNTLTNFMITSNSKEGVFIFDSFFNTFTDFVVLNNTLYDIYPKFQFYHREGCSTIMMQNITGTGNLPILFINKPTNLENMHLAELILCNASYSNLTNITVGGFGNNMLYLFSTNHAHLNHINSSNNRYGIYLKDSMSDIVENSIMSDNVLYDFYFTPVLPKHCPVMQNITGTGNLPILLLNRPTNLENMHLAELILCNASYSNLTNITVGGFGNNMLYILYTNYSKLEDIDSSNNYYGVYLYRSYFNTFADLISNSNKRDGIYFYFYSSNNTVYDSLIADNNEYGVLFEMYSNNNILYNNIFNNTYNIKSDVGLTNLFSVPVIPGFNIVEGNLIAGNVWAKPDGTGFSETCTDANHDGICDSSYDTGAGIDYYPLVLS